MADAYKPMDAFDSMTESTFILKPPLASKQPAAKRGASRPPAFANGGFVPLFQGKEPVESMELRQKLFNEMWEPLEQLLVDTERQVNQVGVSDVCSYVNSSYTRVESVEKGQLDQPFAEMSTAVAFAGVNTGDHSKLFESLQAQLAAGGHHVALLESQYCTSLAGMLKCMLDQVLGSLDEGQRATGDTRTTAIAGAKTISYDMGLLKLRWDEASDGANSRSSRVVVILQDFEGFAPMVVDDFVRIATSYCQSVPIVVVLGLATSYESIHQSLTKASISMLNVEKFNLQRSKECIDAAIQSVFIRATDTLAPLYEVFYYKHSLLLDTTFSAQPRAAVQAALGKTAYYIDCDCCKAVTCDSDGSDMASEDGDDQRVMPSMHDTSIAYRLHQECGRMINLYDWHSAFSSVVEGESSKERGSLPCQRAIQARFMRAVEEMRLLGFIKSTQRKTDHVIRLTWGM
ncbi:Origin recognition complex subunit 3 [Coemansia sp. RSA 2671]|nr:Origin recognition complex subunit 3 [Coemansia sp. RSA 2671]